MKTNDTKNYIWNIIGIITNSITSFFYLFIITRFINVEASGMFSFLFSLGLLIYNVSMFGGRIFFVSDIKKKYSIDDYLTFKFFSSCIGFLLLLIVIFTNNFNNNEKIIITILGLLKIAESISDYFYGLFQVDGRLDLVGKSMAIRSILSMIIFTFMIIMFNKITIASISIFVISLLNLSFWDVLKNIKKIKKSKLNFSKTIDLLKIKKNMLIINVITFLILNVTRYFSYITFSKNIQGFMGIIIMFPTTLAIISEFIYQPKVLTISDYVNQKEKKNITKYLKQSILLIITIGLLGILIIYFGGYKVLNIIFSIDFLPYKNIIIIFLLSGSINAACIIFSNIFTIMRKLEIQIKIYTVVFLFLVFLYYIFPNLELISFSIIFLIGMVLQMLLFIRVYCNLEVGS